MPGTLIAASLWLSFLVAAFFFVAGLTIVFPFRLEIWFRVVPTAKQQDSELPGRAMNSNEVARMALAFVQFWRGTNGATA